MAEREAWRIADAQDQWKLVVINPSFVIGPGVNPHGTSESYSVIEMFGDGTLKSGSMDVGMGTVDVRDLADIQISAAFLPNANGRHIASADNTCLLYTSPSPRDRG